MKQKACLIVIDGWGVSDKQPGACCTARHAFLPRRLAQLLYQSEWSYYIPC